MTIKTEILILPGIKHYETAAFALTWEAYHALDIDDGWVEKSNDDKPNARWKRGTINGRDVVVHCPVEPIASVA